MRVTRHTDDLCDNDVDPKRTTVVRSSIFPLRMPLTYPHYLPGKDTPGKEKQCPKRQKSIPDNPIWTDPDDSKKNGKASGPDKK